MDRTGQTLAGYKLVGVLGRGGMGVVYRGVQPTLDRQVAVKVLTNVSGHTSDDVQRFKRESTLLGAISHPGVVKILDVGFDQDQHFLVMDLVAHPTLADIVPNVEGLGACLPEGRALALTASLLDALSAVHEQGILHRDVKPSNIFVTPEDTVILSDFGLAKLASGGLPVTATSQVIGTIEYMAPEQLDDRGAEIRSDLYAAGLVLYRMLTGRPGYSGAVVDIIRAKYEPTLPTVRTVVPGLSRESDLLVTKACHVDPDKRFPTAVVFRDAILDLLNSRNPAPCATQGAMVEPRTDGPGPSAAGRVDSGRRGPSVSGPSHAGGKLRPGSGARKGRQVASQGPVSDSGRGGHPAAQSETAPSRGRLWIASACLVAIGIGLGGLASRPTSPPPETKRVESSAVPSPAGVPTPLPQPSIPLKIKSEGIWSAMALIWPGYAAGPLDAEVLETAQRSRRSTQDNDALHRKVLERMGRGVSSAELQLLLSKYLIHPGHVTMIAGPRAKSLLTPPPPTGSEAARDTSREDFWGEALTVDSPLYYSRTWLDMCASFLAVIARSRTSSTLPKGVTMKEARALYAYLMLTQSGLHQRIGQAAIAVLDTGQVAYGMTLEMDPAGSDPRRVLERARQFDKLMVQAFRTHPSQPRSSPLTGTPSTGGAP